MNFDVRVEAPEGTFVMGAFFLNLVGNGYQALYGWTDQPSNPPRGFKLTHYQAAAILRDQGLRFGGGSQSALDRAVRVALPTKVGVFAGEENPAMGLASQAWSSGS